MIATERLGTSVSLAAEVARSEGLRGIGILRCNERRGKKAEQPSRKMARSEY